MALRTNSKQAKANLWQYIREASADYIDDRRTYAEREGEPFEYGDTNKDIALLMLDCFKVEKLDHNKQYEAKRGTLFDFFEEWAGGLPFGGVFDYYLHNAVATVAQILEETEAEAGRFTETQAEQFLTRYIFDAIRKEADRYFL